MNSNVTGSISSQYCCLVALYPPNTLAEDEMKQLDGTSKVVGVCYSFTLEDPRSYCPIELRVLLITKDTPLKKSETLFVNTKLAQYSNLVYM